MHSKIKEEIVNQALGEFLHVVAWRRSLHSHPELSFREHVTSRHISEVLEHDGIEFTTVAGTGILARIRGGIAGRDSDAVVLRADIDALPITEAAQVSFSSQNKGVMHACGHDLHTAILLGALRILNRHRAEFPGTVFGLFQPGEELNPGGASLVLDEDPFKDYNIIAFIGEHVEPMMQTGNFGFRAGQYMAASDELRFNVRGKGGHAAMRDKIKDPVLAAALFVEALHDLPHKYGTKEKPVIISVGRLTAEGATNIVPDEVYMEGTMRTFDEGMRARLMETIRGKALDVGEFLGVVIDVNISEGYPSVVNDPVLTGKVESLTRELFGDASVEKLDLRPTSDDFGYYSARYPSVYYRLGVGGTGEFFEKGEAGLVHTPTFCPDEKAMGYGVVQLVNIAMSLLSDTV